MDCKDLVTGLQLDERFDPDGRYPEKWCPCNSGKSYGDCCFHLVKDLPDPADRIFRLLVVRSLEALAAATANGCSPAEIRFIAFMTCVSIRNGNIRTGRSENENSLLPEPPASIRQIVRKEVAALGGCPPSGKRIYRGRPWFAPSKPPFPYNEKLSAFLMTRLKTAEDPLTGRVLLHLFEYLFFMITVEEACGLVPFPPEIQAFWRAANEEPPSYQRKK